MNLPELNQRWQATGNPHAIPAEDKGELYHWHCPRCAQTGVAVLPLMAAMNEALTHKRECPEVP